MLIAPLFVYFTASRDQLKHSTLWELIGLKKEEIIKAFLVPLLLTAVLFMGPIFVHIYNGSWRDYPECKVWKEYFTNVIWLRNHLVAPLSEEFTFRACMIPILLRSFRPMTTVMIQPLFFGVGTRYIYS